MCHVKIILSKLKFYTTEIYIDAIKMPNFALNGFQNFVIVFEFPPKTCCPWLQIAANDCVVMNTS